MTRTGLGPALRRYRKLAGLTQAQLGEQTGFDPKTISRFETGAYTPSVETLVSFARTLGVKPKVFFAEPDDEEEQRAYLFGVIHNAPPKDLGKLIAAVDQVLAKP
ncbi:MULTISPECIES: helix-turn-helix transcriptional regulator [unclassified Pseudomonas]|uniref:helix-turn-helix domain-containing protein n=1 Tax=unclassified Pseudomonas TaxID=196821 RepID=UPI00244B4CAD|nr:MULTISPECIES: helix-turn-helix transcriptional regulator [unclassified Pseudomonas]MDH0302133.1 helix-turn-helix domain-containing protein [Pseudomonas sp. GD04091]MDH1986430.1 helix-turn-helix domain-containing protein [Pseudomonas sp. GD03689]